MNPSICPNCRESLDVPAELRGRDVRCAGCGTVFTAGASGFAPTVLPTRMPRSQQPVESESVQPKSNRTVWVLLFFTGLIAGGMTAACAGFFTWSTNPKMSPVSAEDGRFKLEMPGDAKSITLDGAGDIAVVKGFESSRAMSHDRYYIKYYDLPANADLKDLEAILYGEIQREITGMKPDPKDPPKPDPDPRVKHRITTHDGYPAHDYWREVDPLTMQDATILRAILVGRRVYLLGAKGPGMQPQMWWVMRFFKSFEVAEGPAPEEKKEP